MQKSINIYKWDDGELAFVFFPLRPQEEVLRTVVINDSDLILLEKETVAKVRDILDYLLKN